MAPGFLQVPWYTCFINRDIILPDYCLEVADAIWDLLFSHLYYSGFSLYICDKDTEYIFGYDPLGCELIFPDCSSSDSVTFCSSLYPRLE